MNASPENSASLNSALNDIIRTYLEAVDAGNPPDRLSLLQQHPQFKDALSAFFADQDQASRAAKAKLSEETTLYLAPGSFGGMATPGHLGSDLHDSSPSPRIRYFHNYEILEEIARGGMGVVYKARQTTLDRIVAVKMILAGQLASPADVARFYSEAEAAAKLDHAGIVPIHEVGEHEGQHYFSMGYIEGQSLRERLAAGPLPPRTAAELLHNVSLAVEYAHQEGIIHRDLKPSNILLDIADRPRVADFGLAKRLGGDSSLTTTGQILGTPSYMPPEQAAGAINEIGPASDVYSLGAILYATLTGRPPFQAASAAETLTQVRFAAPASPRLLNPAVTKDLETICLKCLEKEPKSRYSSAADLAEDLRRYLHDEPIVARPVGVVERSLRWLRKQKRSALIGAQAAAAAVVLTVLGTLGWQWRQHALLGTLRLETDTPGIMAEVLDARGEPALLPFRLPTDNPVSLPEGPYQLTLSGTGELSETYLFEVERSKEQTFNVGLRSMKLCPPIDVWSPWASEIIDLGRGPEIIVVPRSHEDQCVVRCISIGTGKPSWEANWTATPGNRFLEAILPANATDLWRWEVGWHILLRQWGRSPSEPYLPPPRLLRPAPDLDGDGVGDLVWAFTNAPRPAPGPSGGYNYESDLGGPILAASGKDGRVLWLFRSKSSGDKSETTGGMRFVDSVVIGAPLVVQSDGKPVLWAAFASQTENKAWIETISGRTGQSLRQLPAEQLATPKPPPAKFPFNDWQIIPFAFEPKLCTIGGKSVVVFVAGTRVFGFDPATGESAWSPYVLNAPLCDAPRFVDLDSDGSEDVVLMHNTTASEKKVLTAVSLNREKQLWQTEINSDADRFRKSGNAHEWPLVANLDADGKHADRKADLVVIDENDPESWTVKTSYRFSGIAMLDGATGQVRWRRRFPRQVLLVQNSELDHPQDRYLIGPDIDGDGLRDVILASMPGGSLTRGELEDEYLLFVDAFSGEDGHSLWSARLPVKASFEIGELENIGDLALAAAASDGLPQLVVPLNKVLLFVSTRSGRLLRSAKDHLPLRFEDFDQDGLVDTCTFIANSPKEFDASDSDSKATGKLHVFKGAPPEAWRRLGSCHVTPDYDGDGTPDAASFVFNDLLSVEAKSSRSLISGRTGRPIRSGPVRWDNSWQDLSYMSLEFPALPEGDLDADGTPDILAATDCSVSQSKGIPIPLQALSGKTGARLWSAGQLDMSAIPTPAAFRSWHVSAARCVNLKQDGRHDVLCQLEMGTADINRDLHGLALVSGQDGAPLWHHWVTGHLANKLCVTATSVDMNKDGVDEVILRHDVLGSDACKLIAVSGRDGTTLWEQDTESQSRTYYNPEKLSPPKVVDLAGHGDYDVLVLDQKFHDSQSGKTGKSVVFQVFEGQTGKPRWSFDPRTGPTQPDFFNIERGSFYVANLAGDGRRAICLAISDRLPRTRFSETPNLKSETILLDVDGQVIDRRDIDGIAAGDLDGNRREDLLTVADGRLRATRGGLEQLVWDKPQFKRSGHLEIQAGAKGRPATVAYAAGDVSDVYSWRRTFLDGDTIYGLDGASGRTIWRGMYDTISELEIGPLKAGADGQLPFSLSRPHDRNVSIARYVLPTGIRGDFPNMFAKQDNASAGASDSASLARSIATDPRFARELPWTELKVPLRNMALHVLLDSLFVCFIPGWLIIWVTRNGTWGMSGMFVLTASVAISIGSYLLLPGPSMENGQGLELQNRTAVLLASAPIIAFSYFLVVWSVERRWRRVFSLVAAVALATIIIAVVALAFDAGAKPAVQHYSLRGWWTIAVPSAWLTGVLTYAVIVLVRPAKAVARHFRPGALARSDQ